MTNLSFVSCRCDKIPQRKQPKGDRVYLAHDVRLTSSQESQGHRSVQEETRPQSRVESNEVTAPC